MAVVDPKQRWIIGRAATCGTAQAVVGFLQLRYPGGATFDVRDTEVSNYRYEIVAEFSDESAFGKEHWSHACRAFVCGRGELVS